MMSEGLQTKRMINAGRPSIKLIARLIVFITQKKSERENESKCFLQKISRLIEGNL